VKKNLIDKSYLPKSLLGGGAAAPGTGAHAA
jgi:hypothetical protein